MNFDVECSKTQEVVVVGSDADHRLFLWFERLDALPGRAITAQFDFRNVPIVQTEFKIKSRAAMFRKRLNRLNRVVCLSHESSETNVVSRSKSLTAFVISSRVW